MFGAIKHARTAVVTGANRGLGQEIAKEFGARGLHVVPTSREPKSDYATLDVADRASIDAFARSQASAGVDVLVNNAGSKIGMNALARVLARELAGDPRGILVNSADPGWVRTRMGGRGAPSSVEDGAKTPVYLALLPAGAPSGGFFADERQTAF
jgi:NAD(P)-dependent dehydrogenase (short-subunit alcohol dehydrogenase family)